MHKCKACGLHEENEQYDMTLGDLTYYVCETVPPDKFYLLDTTTWENNNA